jgi:hypothetical protein
LPIKTVNGTVVYARDVAHVIDGFASQTISCAATASAALLQVEKTGSASTPTIILQVKAMLPKIAACLTAWMVLGLSRQLARDADHHNLVSAFGADLADRTRRLGQPINLMTLGGLALAVGILSMTRLSQWKTSRTTWKTAIRCTTRSQRIRRDRGADLRLDARDLHRVRADLPALGRRRRSIPIYRAPRVASPALLPFTGRDSRQGAGSSVVMVFRVRGPGGSPLLCEEKS